MSKKIQLALLPYWSPLIPPMGISSLKSYLGRHGFDVGIADANVEPRFQELIDRYFQYLRDNVPPTKQGNLDNLGNEVLRHHMMAHRVKRENDHKRNDENGNNGNDADIQYRRLVKELVYNTFYTTFGDEQIKHLADVMETFYERLDEYVIRILEKEKPDVLGLSAYTVTLPATLYAFRRAKEWNPEIETVMGGGIFSGEMDIRSENFKYFMEQTPYIDAVIVGEGEQLLLEYLQGKLPKTKRYYTLADIGEQTMNLAEIPAPDFSDLDIRYYPTMGAYTSRSCPFNCSFCSEKVLWGKYRKKAARQILEELNLQARKYKTQLFLMSDSLLNPVVKDLSQAMIDAGYSYYWDGYLRADPAACNTDNTFQWRRGGFYRARLGLESGSPKILEAMGKKITPRQIKEAVAALAMAGIKTTTYWVIGHPGETEEDFQQTLDLIEEMKDDLYEADCNPFGYFPTGQVQSEQWERENGSRLLYPLESRKHLMLQTWILETNPTREETYRRVNRFVQHCRKLGIPNPYKLKEIYQADERWKKLHSNAVPPMADFMEAKNSGKMNIDENKGIQKVVMAQNLPEIEGDWGF
jgi:radical SAM superfamily enzyme YgiQ (UPF0313 family)